MRRMIWSQCFEDCIRFVQGSDLGRCCEAEKLQELEGWICSTTLQHLTTTLAWYQKQQWWVVFCGAGDACPERARGPKASERQGLRTLTEGWKKIKKSISQFSIPSIPSLEWFTPEFGATLSWCGSTWSNFWKWSCFRIVRLSTTGTSCCHVFSIFFHELYWFYATWLQRMRWNGKQITKSWIGTGCSEFQSCQAAGSTGSIVNFD